MSLVNSWLGMGAFRARNLVSIRLLRNLGVTTAREHISGFGFDLVELRANQVPLDSTDAELAELRRVLDESGVGVSMIVVGDAGRVAGELA